MFLSGSDITKPGVVVMTQGPHTENEAEDDPKLPPDASFMHGFSKGFVNGGVSMINDGVSLVTSVKEKTAQYWNLLIGEGSFWSQVKQDGGTILGTAVSAVKIGLAVHQFIINRQLDTLQASIALITGDDQKIKEMGGDYAEAFSMAAEVMDYAADEWGGLSEGMKGYYMGRLSFEIASFFAGGAIAKTATKAQFVTGLLNRPFFQSGRGASLAARVMTFLQRLLTTKMCFVAGTLVLTESGLRAIESVHAGERVWSRNETTTVEGWQPVVDTFTTHPDTLYTLRLDADGDGHAEEETLTCTGEHPFWVEEARAFVPAAEIRPGWRLLRARGSGQVAELGIESTRAPPGQAYTAYNFEVATDHTYFVGEAEVWVHNFSERFCSKFFSITEKVQQRLGISGDARGNRFVVLTQSLDEAWVHGHRLDAETGNYLMHVTQFEEFRDYANNLSSLASVRHLRALRQRPSAGGFVTGGGFEIHHTAEKWMQRALGVPENLLDDVPGIPLRRAPDLVFDQRYFEKFGKNPVYHGSAAGHGSLANRLGVIRGKFKVDGDKQAMVDAVKDLYDSAPFNDLNMWPVTRDWLRRHATDASILIPD